MKNSLLLEIASEYMKSDDYEKAYRYYLEAAMDGSSKALLALGSLYLFGDVVSEDYDKAGHYFKLAYEAGGRLPGSAYIIIAGCEEELENKSFESEKKWYQLAIDGGCDHGYECMGHLYLENEMYDRALEYFMKPEKRESLSLFDLGWMYENGLGVEKDIQKAIAYYRETVTFCPELKNHGDAFYYKAEERLKQLGVIQ